MRAKDFTTTQFVTTNFEIVIFNKKESHIQLYSCQRCFTVNLNTVIKFYFAD